MFNRSIFCSAVFALGVFTISAARAESILTWADCVQLARHHHPGLIAAQQEILASTAAVRAAKAGKLPQLSAGGRGDYSDSSQSSGSTESYRANIEIEQNLYDGANTRSAVSMAEADLAATLAAARQTETEVLYNARLAYTDLLFAQTQIVLLEQIKERRSDNVEMVELRYMGGQENQGSLAVNQASLHAAEMDLVQARRFLLTSQSVLLRALGLEEDVPGLSVTGRFEDVRVPGSYNLAALVRETPVYIRALAAYERAVAQLQSARSGLRPTVSAYGSASLFGDSPGLGEDSVSAGVRLSLPLWAGGRNRAQIHQAAARQAAAEADLADVVNTQRVNLERALLDYRNAGESVTVQRQYLSAQELRAVIAREQYANGLLKFDNWDIIENDLIGRQKSLLDVRRQALRSEAAWWRATGQSLKADPGESP